MTLQRRIYKIKGVVQHYSWGGYDFIPNLIGENNSEQKPYAEYWLGAHPKGPAMLQQDHLPLNKFIEQHSAEILGKTIFEKYETLPFLVKVLDVRQMLSIQVHPDKESAAKAFDEEESLEIPLNAYNRNYKDKNHKPEMMIALTDFWLLHGFKTEEKLVAILGSIPELSFLLNIFYDQGYEGLLQVVMTLPQKDVNNILAPLMHRIIPAYKTDKFEKSSEHFWAARAATAFCKNDNFDRGILSIYLLNVVHLLPGEGIFQPAGMLHAYLEGQNLEVMANSDNVLRAGLTDKHIDTAELMKHVAFVATVPEVLQSKGDNHIFKTGADEFAVQQLQVDTTYAYVSASAEILLVIDDAITVICGEESIDLKRGEAAFVLPQSKLVLQPNDNAEVFRVFTP